MTVSPPWTDPAHGRALDKAVTPTRMGTYLAAAGHDPALARRLYIWDRDVAAAFLADIAILEVALRNAVVAQLDQLYGVRWFEVDAGFDGPTRRNFKARGTTFPRVGGRQGIWLPASCSAFGKGSSNPAATSAEHLSVFGQTTRSCGWQAYPKPFRAAE